MLNVSQLRRRIAPWRSGPAGRALLAAALRIGAAPVRWLTRAEIRGERELWAYVLRLSLACTSLALVFDVANQLVFFVDLGTALRSWAISTLVAAAISIPVAWGVGKAYLDLSLAKLELERVSRIDPLTGLLNRGALFAEARRSEVAVLVILDVDRFKLINDTHGHLAGDDVLRKIATRMVARLGGFGHLGRLGGEEFALLTSGSSVDEVAKRVRAFKDELSAVPIRADGATVRVTVSAGIAARSPEDTFTDVYRHADRALYAAKATGRNQVVLESDLVADSPRSWAIAAAPRPAEARRCVEAA